MAKFERVRDTLLAGIRSGEFPPESKIPAEREIASRYGVSYVTARKAVADLVEAKLLERRARHGTFVAPATDRLAASAKLVTLICQATDSAFTRAFLRIGLRQIEERGGKARILRVGPGDDQAAARAVESGAPALIQSTGGERRGPLADAMQRANGRAVLVSNRMDDYGVPSVLADDSQALRLAVSHLQEHGHHDIALLCDHATHPVARLQIAAWRAFCAEEFTRETLAHRLILVRSSNLDALARETYEAVRAFLRTPHSHAVTALVSLSEEMAFAALAACRDEGRTVPEKMSIVSLGDNSALAFAHPPVTWVDVDMESHVAQALEILQSAEQETLDPSDRLRLIEPRLVRRQSVAQPYTGNSSG